MNRTLKREFTMAWLVPILVVAGILQASSAATAQELIQRTADLRLSDTASQALNEIKRLTRGDVQVVRIDANQLHRPNLNVSLTPNRSVNFDATSRDSTPSGFASVGAIAGLSPGSTTFAVNGNAVTASIQADDGLYRIRPLTPEGQGGAHALFKAGPQPPEHPRIIQRLRRDADAPLSPEVEVVPEADQSLTEIVVLVAYTPAVASKVADVKGLVDLAFIETNASYTNSAVFIKLISATPRPVLTEYVESGTESSLDALKNPSDRKMDELHQLRDQHKADLVVLLTDDSEFCGLASEIRATKNSAFAVVYHDCATGYYSFAHEIGHLQGARHNDEVDNSDKPFAHGHGYMDPGRDRRTIMAYNCPDGCQRMPQWARPPEWGNVTRAHDARVLNQTRKYIASFR
jgi:peptidyl-Asp metalloendopeptidase